MDTERTYVCFRHLRGNGIVFNRLRSKVHINEGFIKGHQMTGR